MPIVVPVEIPALATPLPDPSDRNTYGTRGRLVWEWENDSLVPGANALAAATYQNAIEAESSALLAAASASFQGAWSARTGAANVPYSVWHSGRVWALLNNLADVTASEPGVSADWADVGGVRRSGDTMTGPLSVPSGASGSQVPQAQETVLKTGATMTGPLSVPSGASGSQVPRADDMFGRAQVKTAVARTNGTTYTNSTGKPIVIVVRGVTAAVADTLSITIDGERAAIASYSAATGANIAVNAVIPAGSTYVVAWTGMTSTNAFEYR